MKKFISICTFALVSLSSYTAFSQQCPSGYPNYCSVSPKNVTGANNLTSILTFVGFLGVIGMVRRRKAA